MGPLSAIFTFNIILGAASFSFFGAPAQASSQRRWVVIDRPTVTTNDLEPAVASDLHIASSSDPATPNAEVSSTVPNDPPSIAPIPGLTRRPLVWSSPSLNPGVPSAFIARWGDVFLSAGLATPGNLRDDVDGAFVAGFGLGDPERFVAVEVAGGCGSVRQFCGNGGVGLSVGRDIITNSHQRLALALAWRNPIQWGYEGTQDNIYSATLTYAIPLRSSTSSFRQTLQFNAGVGNSTFAPFTDDNTEDNIGGFGSVGVELSPSFGISTGWSGRGMNAQISYAPFQNVPISLNFLGADLFNQTPAGTVAIFSINWGSNFRTTSFNSASSTP
jgi:hypothetical protein